MRAAILFFVWAAALKAAVIRGSVVEHATGKPLARAVVALQPIAGTPATAATVRTNSIGAFEFPSLPAGAYVVTASRPGFVTLQAGQKDWKSAGFPIMLEDAAVHIVEMRLRRFGAISGMVLDEEEIGLPDHDVVVYRNTRPPRLLTRTRSDERGAYRLGGLMPGSYLVRTAGKQYDDASYVPTFHRESQEVEQA